MILKWNYIIPTGLTCNEFYSYIHEAMLKNNPLGHIIRTDDIRMFNIPTDSSPITIARKNIRGTSKPKESLVLFVHTSRMHPDALRCSWIRAIVTGKE